MQIVANKNTIAASVLAAVILSLIVPLTVRAEALLPSAPPGQLWHYQCIDTMKYSRDTAREFLGDLKKSTEFINKEVGIIKSLGANCVAIATPYDEEFIPVLSAWVAAARSQGLLIWFRGNFSGWEGWFDYPRFKTTSEHHTKLTDFISSHADLFRDGDILSPAPEAENGMLGNPWRSEASRKALRDFAWQSSDVCQKAVAAISKKIHCGYFSANGDVARDIYNKEVLQKSGAVTVIDHYVSTSSRMGKDLDGYVSKHGLPVMLGEFGAPIPDINGNMTEAQQAQFVGDLFREFYIRRSSIIGINYWVLRGGSTAVLNPDGSERDVAEVIRNYFMPGVIAGKVVDGVGKPVVGARLLAGDGVSETVTDNKGNFALSLPLGNYDITVSKSGYTGKVVRTESIRAKIVTGEVVIHPEKQTLWYRVRAKLNL